YFMSKTLDVLSEFNGKVTLKEFFDSQIRYIVVSVRNWIAELAITIVISIVLGVFGPDSLKPLSKFLVGAYFLGYLFFDGYFHIFNMKIKESNHHIKKHITAVLVLGVVVKLLFAIPYVGAIIGSIIGAVAATWYLHTSEERQIFTETI
ncbi:MAG TPA: hypothetical protein PKD85_06450, partial [Saprospiraceae bacterium]|nr:hypothetical protein [Saprospiraceae bacterium]